MMRARKVDEYFETAHETYQNMLEYILYNVTLYGNTPLFNQVYIPVKRYDTQTQKLADGYTYLNCGMSSTELADLYWARYSGTYLIGRTSVITDDADKIILRAKAVFNQNRGKYLKLIELAGLEWNPLWNVDGTEIRQLLENSGTNDVETGQINTTTGVQWQDTKTTHNVSAYDSGVKKEYEDTVSGNGANIPTGIQRVEYTDGEFTVSNQSPSGSTIASADESTNGVKGKTKYVHNLAKNIINGQELRFSIIDEFFKDINKVILIGVYGDTSPLPWWYYGQSSGGTTPVHPDTGRTTSVHNSSYDMIQSVDLDEYGHVIGLTTCDGVTKVFTPMTQEQYENTDPKDQALYTIYD